MRIKTRNLWITFWIILILLGAAGITKGVKADTLSLTLPLFSIHETDGKNAVNGDDGFNNVNPGIIVNYGLPHTKFYVTAGSYLNSNEETSNLFGVGYYFDPITPNLRFTARAGLVTGYEKFNQRTREIDEVTRPAIVPSLIYKDVLEVSLMPYITRNMSTTTFDTTVVEEDYSLALNVAWRVEF